VPGTDPWRPGSRPETTPYNAPSSMTSRWWNFRVSKISFTWASLSSNSIVTGRGVMIPRTVVFMAVVFMAVMERERGEPHPEVAEASAF
jgi:hypothetical protein